VCGRVVGRGGVCVCMCDRVRAASRAGACGVCVLCGSVSECA